MLVPVPIKEQMRVVVYSDKMLGPVKSWPKLSVIGRLKIFCAKTPKGLFAVGALNYTNNVEQTGQALLQLLGRYGIPTICNVEDTITVQRKKVLLREWSKANSHTEEGRLLEKQIAKAYKILPKIRVNWECEKPCIQDLWALERMLEEKFGIITDSWCRFVPVKGNFQKSIVDGLP